MVELKHLRIVFGSNGLRRLAVDRLHHPFVIQQQRHRERGLLIPQQAVIAGDHHLALRAQRLRHILDGTHLLEVGAHNGLPDKPLLQFIQWLRR